jgi:methionine salvage enolase-phosphatase E1
LRSGKLIAVLAAGLTCSALAATTAPKKKITPRKVSAASKAPVHKAAVHKAGVRKAAANRAPAHKSAAGATRPAWHAGQTEPTPDRYKEIQGALAQKGYLHTEATGVWSQDSVDALRRFQQDQNLQASGKLDSLSIIALGLGPKH